MLKQPGNVDIPSERTVYRVMEDIGISHHSRRKPNEITEADLEAPLCAQTLKNAAEAYPGIRRAIIHSDRGSQYTSQLYRDAIYQHGIRQSMNSAGGRCHDNARCESMWARMKSELLYDRYDTEKNEYR